MKDCSSMAVSFLSVSPNVKQEITHGEALGKP